MFYPIIAFFLVFSSVISQELRCYECEPKKGQNCESVIDVTSSLCSGNRKTANNGATRITEEIVKMGVNCTEPFCYYLYFDTGIPDQAGYYRGCSAKSEGVFEFCSVLTKKMTDIQDGSKMVDCKICDSSNCNGGNFEEVSPETTTPGSLNNKVKSLIGVDTTMGGSGNKTGKVTTALVGDKKRTGSGNGGESDVFSNGYKNLFGFIWLYFFNKVLL